MLSWRFVLTCISVVIHIYTHTHTVHRDGGRLARGSKFVIVFQPDDSAKCKNYRFWASKSIYQPLSLLALSYSLNSPVVWGPDGFADRI